MRRLLPLFFALVIVAALPAAASAGGFATAGLSSTPAGVEPGQPWKVDITVLQHGRTPLEGISPAIRISSGDTQEQFAAKPTDKPGVYSAEVVFPAAGEWEYVVLDGFINEQPHTFPSVRIGDGAAAPAAPSPPDDGGIATGWLWGAGAALALALLVLGADRLRRRQASVPPGAEPA